MTLVRKEHRLFWLRRMHSLAGVVPLGTFFAVHLWLNARAMQGQRAFDDSVRGLSGAPGMLVVEILGVHVPLVFHAAVGLWFGLRGRPDLARYAYPRNWSYALQRVTGVVTLLFILYHVLALRVPLALGRLAPTDLFTTLTDTLSGTTAAGIPLAALAYLVGVASASYHFGNGLAASCSTWGVTVTPQATRVARGVALSLGALLFLLGSSTVLYYATGSAPFGGASE